jgi:2-octaprenyl-6-methoxyphenol hydroxylase
MTKTAWQIAVVGAGPVGTALALHASQLLPHASISLFDARPLDRDVATDPRTLALSLGSVQFLQRLGVWSDGAGQRGAAAQAQAQAQAITEVHISQQAPSFGDAQVRLRAAALGVPQLGAVLSYGALLAPLQQAWLAQAALHPKRLRTRFGNAVIALKALPEGVEVDAGIVESFDLAVVAEGGVFADQTLKSITSNYQQTAWVGTVTLEGATPGLAFERFTRHGPAALLPLPPNSSGQARAALVWCVDGGGPGHSNNDDHNDSDNGADPVRELNDTQRLAVLNTIFPPLAGRITGITSLKEFALGLNAERTLVHGRTVRIGNAAQTLHPVAGQGLNLGLRDAHTLVQTLRWADNMDAALKRAEWARAADRWATIATTDFLARSFTWQLPGAATARGLGLAALQAMPVARDWLARRLMFGLR